MTCLENEPYGVEIYIYAPIGEGVNPSQMGEGFAVLEDSLENRRVTTRHNPSQPVTPVLFVLIVL
jgi:hypothetical protein